MDARSTKVMADAVAGLAKARRDAQNARRHWLHLTVNGAEAAAVEEANLLMQQAQARLDSEVARVVIAWGSVGGEEAHAG